MSKLQFLLLEDSPLDAELIQAVLREAGIQFDLRQVQSEATYWDALKTQKFDLILSDYSLPGFNGVAALALAQQLCPQIPFIFVSATLGEELAIETLKSGATDYVLKQRLERLPPAIRRALREAQERQNRQRAEMALREAKDLYRLLFEQSPFGVLLIRTKDLTFVEFNAQAHQQLGYTSEEFAQLTLAEIEVAEFQAISAQIQAAVQQGFNQFESRHRSKTGELREVLVTAQFIQISGEQYLHGIWQDITDRKRAEAVLHQRNERLKLLYEATSGLLSTDQPVALLDDLFRKLAVHLNLHCYLSFLVESTEPVEPKSRLRLIAYSGLSEADSQLMQNLEMEQTLCGMAIAENRPIIVPDVQQSTHPRIALIQSLGITAYVSYPLVVRGRLLGALSFGSRSRTHFTAGELNLLQATADQVAVALERSNLLTSLQQQTEQLTQANRVKDEFLAVLSHELRTPLNPILGWARLLQSRKYDEATTTRALEIIERNAKIQTQLIEDLLDVSRILQGKLSLSVAPVDLVPMIEASLETVQLAAEAKGIALQFLMTPFAAEALEASPPRPANFLALGDANRLQQVVWNLLSNAVKFTPEGGEVTIELRRTGAQPNPAQPNPRTTANHDVAELKREFGYAEIIVSDTGRGIQPEFLPYVFDYFRQADGSTTRAFGGLGLGLAIVRHLVELHGGTIAATSAGENQGATFAVKLPLFQANRHLPYLQVPLPALSLTYPLDGVKVLLVDDEKDALDFATFLLEQSGATVTATISAQAALEALSHTKPDILISDIAMPSQDGYMLLQQVRQLAAPRNKIPAIALTAYAREEDSRRAYAVGFQKHLAKPIEPTTLITAVAELTGRSSTQ